MSGRLPLREIEGVAKRTQQFGKCDPIELLGGVRDRVH
jgi:hypothetical protein